MILIDTKSRVNIRCDNFLPGVPMGIDISIADPRQSGLTVKSIPGKVKYRSLKKILRGKKHDLDPLFLNPMGAGGIELESYSSN